MKKVAHIVRQIVCDTRGATAVEYGLFAALIALAAVAAMQNTGNSLSGVMTRASTGMSSA